MKKLAAAALGALVLTGTAATTVTTAEARPHGYHHGPGHHHGYYRYRGRGHGDAVAAGVAGLAIGALIGSAAASPRYYAPPPAYYPPPSYYRPQVCRIGDWVWDPYLGARVYVERNVRC